MLSREVVEKVLAGTTKEAADVLAVLFENRTDLQKNANWWDSLSSGVSSQFAKNPYATSALLGGGLGAAAMGASTAVNNAKSPEKRKRSVLQSAILGASGGALAGMGVAGGIRGLNSAGGPDKLPANQYVDPVTGQRIQIDTDKLVKNPELMARIKDLTSPDLQERIYGGVSDAWKYVSREVPVASRVMPVLGLLDAARYLRPGTFTDVSPGEFKGKDATAWFRRGIPSSALPESLKTMIIEGKSYNDLLGSKSRIKLDPRLTSLDKALSYVIGQRHLDSTSSAPLLSVKAPLMQPVNYKAVQNRGAPNPHGTLPPSVAKEYTRNEQVYKTVNKMIGGKPTKVKVPLFHKPEVLTEAAAHHAKLEGFKADPRFEGRQLRWLPGAGYYRSFKSPTAAIASRIAMYGAPTLAEYWYQGKMDTEAKQKTLREIMQQIAKPAK
jgi:hypothetical protein